MPLERQFPALALAKLKVNSGQKHSAEAGLVGHTPTVEPTRDEPSRSISAVQYFKLLWLIVLLQLN